MDHLIIIHVQFGFNQNYCFGWIYSYLCNLGLSPLKFESRSGQVYLIQHYVIKFVSALQQVCGFLRVLRFSTNTTNAI
jgi:hypothetical protein